MWDEEGGIDLSTDVPEEVLRHILSLLDPLALAHASTACRKWHELATDEALWQHHVASLPADVLAAVDTRLAAEGRAGSRERLKATLAGADAVPTCKVAASLAVVPGT